MRTLDDSTTHQNILKNINPGDLIHVETFKGDKYEILVKSISLEAVKGEHIEVPLDQIKTIKKKQISVLKTTGAVAGTLWVYSAIAILLFLAAFK